MSEITIGTTVYQVEGPSLAGTYFLTGPRGAEFITQAFASDAHMFRLLGWSRGSGCTLREHRVRGNRVLLTDADGTLRQAAR